MFTGVYNSMLVGVMYDALYKLDGRACVIKKAAEDIRLGYLTCQFEDGTIKRHHYAFFECLRLSKQMTFRP